MMMQRIHYMDNLRALAMMAGVFFHAALAYSPALYKFYPVADRQQSAMVDVLSWFPHLFRMPLFFLVAGFFCALLVSKGGIGAMLANRMRRVALPFVIFWPLVIAAIVLSVSYAMNQVTHLPPLLVLARQMAEMENPPAQPLSTTHLWFLYYLTMFYLLVWALNTFKIGFIANRIAALSPAVILVLAPLLFVPALAAVSTPFPAPESFVPRFWALGFFGLYFAYGYILFSHQHLIDKFKPYLVYLLIASLIAYGFYMALLDDRFFVNGANQWNWFVVVLEAYIGVWMTVASLLLGKRFLNGHSKFLRYISDASYWVYILHLPVLFAVQFWLMDREFGLLLKYCLSMLMTLAICFISYQLLVRKTIVGRLLNGRKSVPSGTARESINPVA